MTRLENSPLPISEPKIIEAGTTSAEQLPSPERPRLRLVKSIALTGPESSGKGEVLRILQERHGWKVFDGSEIGFERKGKKPERGYIERTAKQHRTMDRRQARIFRNLAPDGEQLVAEAKLSGIILAEQKDIREDQIEKIEMQNRPRIQDGRRPIESPKPIPAVTINLWATKEIRIKRAYNDAINKYVTHFEKYLKQSQLIMDGVKISDDELVPPPPDNPPTKDMIEELMEERQKRDITDWAPFHPNYVKIGENPYSRTLERPKNRGFVYERWIDTSKMTPEEVANKLEVFAMELGAVVPLTFKEHEAIARNIDIDELPSSGDVFDFKKVEARDVVKTNGEKKPANFSEDNFQGKSKSNTGNGKSFGEPVSRRSKFPSKHPNLRHPSRSRKGSDSTA